VKNDVKMSGDRRTEGGKKDEEVALNDHYQGGGEARSVFILEGNGGFVGGGDNKRKS